MMIHKITPTKNYNYWLKLLDTQLYEPTNELKFNKNPHKSHRANK